jgi:hypothetical protein
MKMERLIIQLPKPMKAYTASGFIRSLLERELNQPSPKSGMVTS